MWFCEIRAGTYRAFIDSDLEMLVIVLPMKGYQEGCKDSNNPLVALGIFYWLDLNCVELGCCCHISSILMVDCFIALNSLKVRVMFDWMFYLMEFVPCCVCLIQRTQNVMLNRTSCCKDDGSIILSLICD